MEWTTNLKMLILHSISFLEVNSLFQCSKVYAIYLFLPTKGDKGQIGPTGPPGVKGDQVSMSISVLIELLIHP